MGGERTELPVFPHGATMLDLRQAVKNVWKMPLASQCFVLPDGSMVKACDAEQVSDVFQELLVASTTDIVELQLVRGALPADKQQAVDIALMVAVARGIVEDVEEAISEGADCNYSANDLTPLMLARAAQDDHVAKLLLQANAKDPSMKPVCGGLGEAFRRKDLADVTRFLGRGADPNTHLSRGQGIDATSSGKPLHACCALHRTAGALPVVELLLRLRADPGVRDAEGDTPLAHARYFAAPLIYEALERQGAKVEGPYYSAAHRAGRQFLGWR